MKTVIKPNRWSCLPASFAMAIGVAFDDIISYIGHDGGQIVAPGYVEPLNRRGFHIQECVWAAVSLGNAVTPVELEPGLKTPNGVVLRVHHLGSVDNNWDRFKSLLNTTRGVVEGVMRGTRHACAYENGVIVNPDNGESFPYSRENCEHRGFFTQCLWIVT